MPVVQLTKSRSLNLAKLNTYTAETSTAKALQSRVRELYKNSTIKHLKTAEKVLQYIENDNIHKFASVLKKLENKK